MEYQQRSPYQTTVIEQPLVVVPLVSGPSAIITRHAPAHIRNGTKVCGHLVDVRCICCISVFGVIMFAMGALTLMLTNWNLDYNQSLDNSIPSTAIDGIILMLLGAPFLFLSAYLCGISKRDYNRQQSQENTSPYSEPFIEGRNNSGIFHSRQRQSAIRQHVAATSPSAYNYEPLPSPPTAPPAYEGPAYEAVLTEVPPSTQHIHQHTDGEVMIQAPEGIPNNSSSVSYSTVTGSEQQTPQPLIDNFAAVVPDSQAPYTELEMALAQVYEQHPANAPPEYSP